jgi:hypothetical protein
MGDTGGFRLDASEPFVPGTPGDRGCGGVFCIFPAVQLFLDVRRLYSTWGSHMQLGRYSGDCMTRRIRKVPFSEIL